jgi:hypothetical protein
MKIIFAFGMFTYDSVVLKLREAEREVWTRKNDLLLLECYKICFLWKKKARDVYLRVTDLYVKSRSALPLPSDALLSHPTRPFSFNSSCLCYSHSSSLYHTLGVLTTPYTRCIESSGLQL